MPHVPIIVVRDEQGNEIGHSDGHEGDELGTQDVREEIVVTLNVSKVIELHNINVNKGKDKDE